MAAVPLEIVAGSTVYRHIPEKNADYYAPESMFPDPPAEHVWRYCVAKAHGNTIYFSNKKSSASVWILPDINAADGSTDIASVVMKTRGTTDSATTRRASTASAAQPSTPVVPPSSEPGPATASRFGVREASPSPAATQSTPPVVGSTPVSVAPASSADDIKKSIQEKLQESIRQRLAARNGTASASPTLPTVPPAAAVAPAVKQVPVAAAASSVNSAEIKAPLSSDAVAEEVSRPSPSPSSGGSVRDRLAAWRAGKSDGRGRGASRSVTPQGSVHSNTQADENQHRQAASEDSVVRALERDAQRGASTPRDTPSSPPRDESSREHHSIGLTKPTAVRVSATPPSSDASPAIASTMDDFYEAKRKQMLAADEELQRQKADLVRAERMAVERAKLAAETRAREEENYARIVAERRRLEEERLAIEVKERERLLYLLGRAEVAAVTTQAAEAINQFEQAAEEAKRREEAAAARARSFTEAVAASMAQHFAPREASHKQAPLGGASNANDDDDDLDGPQLQKRLHSLMVSDASRSHVKDSSVIGNSLGDKTVQRIQYTPQIAYIGHLGGGPSAGSNPLLHGKRHGVGVLRYDTQGSVEYQGQWKDDKKHGRGDMTTPLTAYEGRWRQDRIDGAGMLQTKTLKASVEAKRGRVHGSSIIQTVTGDTFVGHVDENTLVGPGALSLSTGDSVEWQWSDSKRPGTGQVRVQFANGDHYVGLVEQFKPHGRGAFASADGHEYIGDFVEGHFHGRGFFRFDNGNTYEGALEHSVFHGHGVYVSAGDYVYDGEWEDGQMHGKGTITYQNGDVWQGVLDRDTRKEGRYIASSRFQLSIPA